MGERNGRKTSRWQPLGAMQKGTALRAQYIGQGASARNLTLLLRRGSVQSLMIELMALLARCQQHQLDMRTRLASKRVPRDSCKEQTAGKHAAPSGEELLDFAYNLVIGAHCQAGKPWSLLNLKGGLSLKEPPLIHYPATHELMERADEDDKYSPAP
eukprot:1905956-Pleurochrysis_carterae.AAC.2